MAALPALTALAVLLCACAKQPEFKIDIRLANLNTPPTIVFVGDNGLATVNSVATDNNTFTAVGESELYTLVSIVDDGKLIAQLVARNGEDISVDGDALSPGTINVKGNQINEDWTAFRKNNGHLYSDPTQRDKIIEDYIEKNPKNPLCNALLIADYTHLDNTAHVNTLVDKIQPEARLQNILNTYQQIAHEAIEKPASIQSMRLRRLGGTFENYDPDRVKPLLVIVWEKAMADRANIAAMIKAAQQRSDFNVIDILASPDSIGWHNMAIAGGADWPHFWAPAGTADQAIEYLNIQALPTYIATDNRANVTYFGTDFDQAIAHAMKGK